jgi:hypothetical protein
VSDRPDDLEISGGGSIAVGTDVMLEASARLNEAESELTACLRQLAVIEAALSSPALSGPALSGAALPVRAATQQLTQATQLLGRARTTSGVMHFALDRAADAYGIADGEVKRLSHDVAGGIGYIAGRAFPFILERLAPVLIGPAILLAVVSARMPDAEKAALKQKLEDWFKPHRAFMSDPTFVKAVGLAVTSVDDFGAGALQLPPDLEAALNRAGIIGVGTSAATIAGIGGAFGLLKESAVSTKQTSTSTKDLSLPVGWHDRATRVPPSATSASQVRIDRYAVAGQPDRFEVYIGGTRIFDPGPDDQPLDMTSNMSAISGGESGAMQVVEQAMKAAGVTSANPVIFTGHSQGGLVAARLAGSGDYNSQGLFTLGAPAGQVSVPESVPWVAIQHDNDLVPVLGGPYEKSQPLLVTREYAPEPGSAESRVFYPVHMLPAYEKSATLLDGSTEPRIVAIERDFDRFEVDAVPVESTTWQGVRER